MWVASSRVAQLILALGWSGHARVIWESRMNNYDETVKCYDEPGTPIEMREHYVNIQRVGKRRILNESIFYSIFLQLRGIDDILGGRGKILEVGPGAKYLWMLLKEIGYTDIITLDAQQDLDPDILCDIRNVDENKYATHFDLIACFQLLEHIPYKDFKRVLRKFHVMTKKYVFISVPFVGRHIYINFQLLKRLSNFVLRKFMNKSRYFDVAKGTLFTIPYINLANGKYREEFKREFPFAVHYWEIGRNGLTKKNFLGDIEKEGFLVKQTFHNKLYPSHFFALCEKII